MVEKSSTGRPSKPFVSKSPPSFPSPGHSVSSLGRVACSLWLVRFLRRGVTLNCVATPGSNLRIPAFRNRRRLPRRNWTRILNGFASSACMRAFFERFYFVTTEMDDFVRVGGLAAVSAALPAHCGAVMTSASCFRIPRRRRAIPAYPDRRKCPPLADNAGIVRSG